MTSSLRVAFAGTPDFAVAPLRAILASRHAVVGVLTQPDRPAGRGRKLTASPVKTCALAAGVPVVQPATLRSAAGRAALAAFSPDVLVVVAYGLILPPEALAIPRLGCLNIHASLLPRWRGAAPIQRAILAGDSATGVTIMQMDSGLDTGPMLLSAPLPIARAMDAPALHDALSLLGSRLIVEALDGLVAGTLRAQPQPADGVTYAAKLARSEAPLDFARPAHELERQVRALAGWPVAETSWRGQQLRVHAAVALDDGATAAGAAAARAAGAPPGTVLGTVAVPAGLPGAGDVALAVLCAAGVLALRTVQRAGRRALSAQEFLRGESLAGAVLGDAPAAGERD